MDVTDDEPRGRPFADIVPQRERAERRSTDVFLADLAEIRLLATRLGVVSDPADFDTGLTTDDTNG